MYTGAMDSRTTAIVSSTAIAAITRQSGSAEAESSVVGIALSAFSGRLPDHFF